MKPYKCDTFSARFLNRRDLIMHIRTHTGEKPDKCENCDAKFSRIDNLNVHTRIHTVENVHKISVQESSMPFSNTEQEATRTLGGHELIEVEQGMKTHPGECCGNREVAITVGGISWWRHVERSQIRT